MVYSAKHELAKCLREVLDPFWHYYSEYCILDSFQFASDIRKLRRTVVTEFLMSFDIYNLFTNVPLDETIDICADYRGPLKPPSFPESVFVELMAMAAKSVCLILICINKLMG